MKRADSFAFALLVALAFLLVVGVVAPVPATIVAYLLSLASPTTPTLAIVVICGGLYIVTMTAGVVLLYRLTRNRRV